MSAWAERIRGKITRPLMRCWGRLAGRSVAENAPEINKRLRAYELVMRNGWLAGFWQSIWGRSWLEGWLAAAGVELVAVMEERSGARASFTAAHCLGDQLELVCAFPMDKAAEALGCLSLPAGVLAASGIVPYGRRAAWREAHGRGREAETLANFDYPFAISARIERFPFLLACAGELKSLLESQRESPRVQGPRVAKPAKLCRSKARKEGLLGRGLGLLCPNLSQGDLARIFRAGEDAKERLLLRKLLLLAAFFLAIALLLWTPGQLASTLMNWREGQAALEALLSGAAGLRESEILTQIGLAALSGGALALAAGLCAKRIWDNLMAMLGGRLPIFRDSKLARAEKLAAKVKVFGRKIPKEAELVERKQGQ